MIKVTREKDGIRAEAHGDGVDVLDELAHAAYTVACNMMDAKDQRLDAQTTALVALTLVELIDLVQSEADGVKQGAVLRECEGKILARMANHRERERGLLQ